MTTQVFLKSETVEEVYVEISRILLDFLNKRAEKTGEDRRKLSMSIGRGMIYVGTQYLASPMGLSEFSEVEPLVTEFQQNLCIKALEKELSR